MGVVRTLSDSQGLAVLGEVGFGRLAVMSAEGPYAVPMLFAVDQRSLLLYSTPGRKLQALRDHPERVTLEVDDVGSRPDWRSILVVGSFSESSAGREQLRMAFAASSHPYAPIALIDLDRPDTVTGRLSIDELSGRTMAP